MAPERLEPVTGKGSLVAVGRPVFYADAPGDKKMKGEGGILFNGDGDGYKQASAVGIPTDNQVLEVWVKPRLNTQLSEKEISRHRCYFPMGQLKKDMCLFIRKGIGILSPAVRDG